MRSVTVSGYRRTARGLEVARVRVAAHRRWAQLVESFAAVAVVRGEGAARTRGHDEPVAAGAARSIWPRELLVLDAGSAGLDLAIVLVPPSALADHRTASPLVPPEAAVARLCDRAVTAVGAGHADAEPAVDRLLAVLPDRRTVEVGRYATGFLEPGPVRRARRVLEEHCTTRVRLDELAAAVGMSKFHLLRTFRDYHGLPPHAYLGHLRVARARTLLAAGGACSDVASAAGFADPSHLSRAFRAITGLTPSAFASAVAAADPLLPCNGVGGPAA